MTFSVSSSGEVDNNTPEPTTYTAPPRAPSKPRATKALPTDRMKWEVAVSSLKAFATQSENGRRAIGSDDIAPRLGVTQSTAGLNNAFFAECGLIEREKKGLYKPTEAVIRFAQQHSFDPITAGHELAPLFKETWFFQAAAREPLDRDGMIRVLAHEAGVGKERATQLNTLLLWLEYAGLLSEVNGKLTVPQDARNNAPTPDPDHPADPKGEAATIPDNPPADGLPNVEERKLQQQRGVALLSFNFDFSLTADDIRQLTPEQIAALYEAVGKVMAIRATIDK